MPAANMPVVLRLYQSKVAVRQLLKAYRSKPTLNVVTFSHVKLLLTRPGEVM